MYNLSLYNDSCSLTRHANTSSLYEVLKKIYILLYQTESDAFSLFSGVFFLHSTCCNMYMWYCKGRGKQRIITSFNLQTWGDTSTCNLADVTTPQKVTTNICANVLIFKRLAYMLTAYCYGSKSVTQPDASSKRYLWDKISC